MSIILSIRLPDDLADELDHVSRETERSKSFHVQKAIEAYLHEPADFQIALDRLHDLSDPFVTIGQMRSDLGI